MDGKQEELKAMREGGGELIQERAGRMMVDRDCHFEDANSTLVLSCNDLNDKKSTGKVDL